MIEHSSEEIIPWESRRELGAVRSLWQTWKLSLFRPEFFFKKLKPQGDKENIWSAFLYFLIFNGFALCCAILYKSLWKTSTWVSIGTLIYVWIEALLGLPLRVPPFRTLAHSKEGPWVRVFAYSQGPCVFFIIPVLGPLTASIWEISLFWIGYRKTNQYSDGENIKKLFPLYVFFGLLLTVHGLYILFYLAILFLKS